MIMTSTYKTGMVKLTALAFTILIFALAGCGNKTDDTLTREDTLHLVAAIDLSNKGEYKLAIDEFEAYFSSKRPHRSRLDLDVYHKFTWVLFCDYQQNRALQVNNYADSLATIIGDEVMKGQFRYNNGRYLNYDDVPKAMRYMKEGITIVEKQLAGSKDESERRLCEGILRASYPHFIGMMDETFDKKSYIDRYRFLIEKGRSESADPVNSFDNEFFTLHIMEVVYFEAQNDYDNAMKAYDNMQKCQMAKTEYGKLMSSEKLVTLKRFEEAIPMTLEVIENMKKEEPNIDISENYLSVLSQLEWCYQNTGDKRLEEVRQEKDRVTKSVTQHHFMQKTGQLTEEFNTRQKEYELEVSKAEGLLYKVLFGASLLLAVMVIVAMLVMARYNHIIRKKNAILARNIKELLRKKAQERKEEEERTKSTTESKPAVDEETVTDIKRFIHELTTRELFCNADFDRDTLLAELRIQKTSFGRNFEAVTGQAFAKYLLNLRLEQAALMITQHPEYTVEAIAADCGIPSRSTFYRNFQDRFGITPTEYRKQI